MDPERHARPLSIAGTLAVVAGLYSGTDAGWLAVAVGVMLLLTACYSRHDGFLLFGPFARVDAVRRARSRRTHIVRAVTALAVGALLIFNGGEFQTYHDRTFASPSRIIRNQLQQNQIVTWLALPIGFLVPVLTVLLVSGAIAEEKAGRRWEVLMATDLRAREIVFGKLLGKLWLVLEPVTVIVPVLAMLPLLIPLSPEAMLLYGGAVFVTMLALAGLSALMSACFQSRSGAVWLVVVIATGYLALSSKLLVYAKETIGWTFRSSTGTHGSLIVADLVEAVNIANPVSTLDFVKAYLPPSPLLPICAAALRQYSAGAVGVFLAGTLLACRRVRTVQAVLATIVTEPRPSRPRKVRVSQRVRSAKLRPPVTDEPLAWWANCRFGVSRTGPTRRRSAALGFGLCVGALLASYAADLVGQVTLYPWLESIGLRPNFWIVSSSLRGMVAFAVPAVCLIALIIPVVAATQSIARERSGDTLDSLRLTPLTAREMLEQIRVGCLTSHRLALLLWSVPTLAAVVTGFFPPHVAIALGLLALSVTPPLVNFALYCSAWASTPTRAARNLLVGGAAFHGGLFVAGVICFVTASNLLSVDVDRLLDFRTDPWEFVSPGSTRPTFRVVNGFSVAIGRTIEGDLVTVGIAAVIVGVYYLVGRWVFNRAVGRFAKSRDATA